MADNNVPLCHLLLVRAWLDISTFVTQHENEFIHVLKYFRLVHFCRSVFSLTRAHMSFSVSLLWFVSFDILTLFPYHPYTLCLVPVPFSIGPCWVQDLVIARVVNSAQMLCPPPFTSVFLLLSLHLSAPCITGRPTANVSYSLRESGWADRSLP